MLKKNKAVLIFLLRFFVSYFILSSIYQFYLSKTTADKELFTSDPITCMVAKQTVGIANFIGLNFRTVQHTQELSYKLFTNEHYVARVVEGCNSISVIVLFLAFIIAFAGKIKHTFLFGIIGSLLIYILNLFRIILLTVAIDTLPEHTDFLHRIVFPAIIYGFTFLLWVVWVKYYAIKKRRLKN